MKGMGADQTIYPSEELAQAFLTALQAHDKAAILSILSDDFVLEVPFNISGTNDLSESWRGLEAVSMNLDMAFTAIAVSKYAEFEITPGRNPNVAFVEARGSMTMASGRPYNNRYIFRFDIEGGKIKRIREYANPVTGAIAFGIPLPRTSSDFSEQCVTAHSTADSRKKP